MTDTDYQPSDAEIEKLYDQMEKILWTLPLGITPEWLVRFLVAVPMSYGIEGERAAVLLKAAADAAPKISEQCKDSGPDGLH